MDFGAFINVIPLSIAKKINYRWDKTDAQIIHLNIYLGQTIGEHRNVLIRLSKYDQFHQRINIIIVDIEKSYGLLNRDWSIKL